MEDEFTVDGINGTTTMNRAAYEDYQQRLACRRAEGRYTLEEAAMMFAEETKESAATMLKKLVQAVRDGKLPVFEPGRHLHYQPNKSRDFYEEVFWDDLNTWLADNEQRITWRFPMPDELRDEMEGDAVLAETVYNGKTIDWRYWVHQMPMLSAAQASRLMSVLDPDIFENLDSRPNKNDPSRACDKAKQMQRLAETQGKRNATPAEWLEWAKSLGYRVHTGFVLAVGELPEAAHATVEAETSQPGKPLQRQLFQEQEILRVIRELKYQSTRLPKAKLGKSGVKAEVRAKLTFDTGVFDKAWERLRKQELIQDAT